MQRRHLLAVHGNAVAVLEFEFDERGFVRGIFRKDRERGEVITILRIPRVEPRVFQDASLIADVQEIAVHAEGLLGARLHRDLLLFAVSNHLRATGEVVAETLVAPRGDDFQLRCQSSSGEFKAHLVVTLARGTMRDGIGLLGAGDLHHALGDQRTRDAGAEEILAFIDRSGLDDRVDEVAGELFLQVVDVDLRCACGLRLLGQSTQLIVLADIGAERDDFGLIRVLDPGQQDGGVETTGVSENDLFHVAGSGDCHGLQGFPRDCLALEGRACAISSTARSVAPASH